MRQLKERQTLKILEKILEIILIFLTKIDNTYLIQKDSKRGKEETEYDTKLLQVRPISS